MAVEVGSPGCVCWFLSCSHLLTEEGFSREQVITPIPLKPHYKHRPKPVLGPLRRVNPCVRVTRLRTLLNNQKAGLERSLRTQERLWLFHRAQVQFPAPRLGGSQLLSIPALGSSNTHTHIFLKKKSQINSTEKELGT